MPRITVQPVNSEGEPRRWTLSERIVAENLNSDHYSAHLIERLRWATADAEAVEPATTPGVKPSLASGPIGRGATNAPTARVHA